MYFMLMDSITRLARAFNQAIKGGGKAMSGGIDARALGNAAEDFCRRSQYT